MSHPQAGQSERIVLSGPQVAYIARYHPNGVDIAARGEFIHMRGPDDERGGLVGGELSSHPGMAGCIGMSRDAFLKLPAQATTREPLS
jgi:hypothetical protein